MANGDKAKYLLSSNKQSANSRHSSPRFVESTALRKIDGPLNIGDGEYCRWRNDELCKLYDDNDIVQRMKIQRLRWLRHVVQMDESTPALKVFDVASSGGSRAVGNTPNCEKKKRMARYFWFGCNRVAQPKMGRS